MGVTCPLCGKDDNVQKVSAIVDGGTSVSSYSGVAPSVNVYDGKVGYGGAYVAGNVRSSSHLAQKLAPPVKPNEPRTPAKIGLGWLLLILFGAFSIYCISMDYIDMGLVLCGFLPVIIAGIMIFAGNNEKQKIKENYEKGMPIWKEEMARWNKLYYCHRDDIMFDPESGQYWFWEKK